MHAVLRRALEIAMRDELVVRNVARLVSPPRSQHDEVKPLTPVEARAFLEALRGHRLEALFALAMATGMRQSEILGLQWDAVDLERGELAVRRTLQRYDHGYHLDEPKTPRSARTLSLAPAVLEALRSHRVRQLEERLAAGPMWDESWGLAFCRADGYPLSGPVITKEFQQLLDEAGLRHLRFHDLRHGAATYLLHAGVPLRVTMEILGHSQIATTADLYGHVLEDAQRDAARRVASTLFG